MDIETELRLELNDFSTFSNWLCISFVHCIIMNFSSLCQVRSLAIVCTVRMYPDSVPHAAYL